MTVGEMKKILADLPDDAPICYHYHYKGCGIKPYVRDDLWLFKPKQDVEAVVINPGEGYDHRTSVVTHNGIVRDFSNRMIDLVSGSSDKAVEEAIQASHPETDLVRPAVASKDCLAADGLAMKLVHQRHAKRDLVNLVRWLLLGTPYLEPKQHDGQEETD
jgi:hypothetical protein